MGETSRQCHAWEPKERIILPLRRCNFIAMQNTLQILQHTQYYHIRNGNNMVASNITLLWLGGEKEILHFKHLYNFTSKLQNDTSFSSSKVFSC